MLIWLCALSLYWQWSRWPPGWSGCWTRFTSVSSAVSTPSTRRAGSSGCVCVSCWRSERRWAARLPQTLPQTHTCPAGRRSEYDRTGRMSRVWQCLAPSPPVPQLIVYHYYHQCSPREHHVDTVTIQYTIHNAAYKTDILCYNDKFLILAFFYRMESHCRMERPVTMYIVQYMN